MVSSALSLLPADQLSLINSLLRQSGLSVREVGRMTYGIMGSVGHLRSERGWEACLYRHKEAGNHLKVVRQGNVMSDTYVISDLTIRAIENQLATEGPVNITLLSLLKVLKGAAPQSLMQKLEAEVDARITAADKEPSNTIPRNPDPAYT